MHSLYLSLLRRLQGLLRGSRNLGLEKLLKQQNQRYLPLRLTFLSSLLVSCAFSFSLFFPRFQGDLIRLLFLL